GSKKSEGGPQKAEVRLSDDAQQASPLFFNLPFLPQNGADGETRTLVGRTRPAVYETAAVAAEPHRRNGGSPRCCPVLCGLRDRCIAAMLATRMNATRRRS